MTQTNDHGQTTLDVSETLVRFGVSKRTELRVVVPNYFATLTGPISGTGFGDVAIGMKQQIGPLQGDFDLSVIIALSLPLGPNEFRATVAIRSSSFRGPRILRRAGRSAAWNRHSGTRKITGET
jgi:hypothetical protein